MFRKPRPFFPCTLLIMPLHALPRRLLHKMELMCVCNSETTPTLNDSGGVLVLEEKYHTMNLRCCRRIVYSPFTAAPRTKKIYKLEHVEVIRNISTSFLPRSIKRKTNNNFQALARAVYRGNVVLGSSCGIVIVNFNFSLSYDSMFICSDAAPFPSAYHINQKLSKTYGVPRIL